MANHTITFPITDPREILQLRAGDEVTVQGHIIGIPRPHPDPHLRPGWSSRRWISSGAFLLHTAPNVRKVAEGKYEKVCIGTTTSARMVRFHEPLGRRYGVAPSAARGASPTRRSHRCTSSECLLRDRRGAAALETTQIEEIEQVMWKT